MENLETTLNDPGRFAARTTGDPEQTRAFAIAAAQSLIDDKCEDVLVLDVTKTSPVTDYILIATGTSERQMRAALSHAVDLGEEMGFPRYGAHSDERGTWQLADFVDAVIHVFEPNARAHYDLEMLWGEAPRVEIPARQKGAGEG